MKKGISKPVLAFVIAGLALALGATWYGLTRSVKTPPAETPSTTVQTETVVPEDAPEPVPAEVVAPDRTLNGLIPLPLTGVLVEAENSIWRTDKDCLAVPHGTQPLCGIEFHIDGLIQLQGTGSEALGRKYRSHLILPLAQAGVVNARFGSIHLLTGTCFQAEPDANVADLVWKYSDGTVSHTPLLYQHHVRDWIRPPYEEPPHLPYALSKLAWRSEDPSEPNRWRRLYRVTLANPEPAKRVRQLEVASAHGRATLMIVAATVDPLAAGERSDDSPDVEPGDPIPPRYVELVAQTPEGQLLPQATVNAQFRLRNGRSPTDTRQQMTDLSGSARVAYPAYNLDKLEIAASHDDYSGRKMVWDIRAGDIVPPSYRLKLAHAVTIGGVVVAENDSPISGVKLSAGRFWTAGEDKNRKGEQPDFPPRNVISDSQGTWQMKGLPDELLDHISLTVEHPDYMTTNFTVGGNETIERRLRGGTHKLVLRPIRNPTPSLRSEKSASLP